MAAERQASRWETYLGLGVMCRRRCRESAGRCPQGLSRPQRIQTLSDVHTGAPRFPYLCSQGRDVGCFHFVTFMTNAAVNIRVEVLCGRNAVISPGSGVLGRAVAICGVSSPTGSARGSRPPCPRGHLSLSGHLSRCGVLSRWGD